jgi:hypothetical protein
MAFSLVGLLLLSVAATLGRSRRGGLIGIGSSIFPRVVAGRAWRRADARPRASVFRSAATSDRRSPALAAFFVVPRAEEPGVVR